MPRKSEIWPITWQRGEKGRGGTRAAAAAREREQIQDLADHLGSKGKRKGALRPQRHSRRACGAGESDTGHSRMWSEKSLPASPHLTLGPS